MIKHYLKYEEDYVPASFPCTKEEQPLIYLDNSATTKPYKEVIDTYTNVSANFFANPSSLHSLGGQADRLLAQSREVISKLLQVKPRDIYFTSGGTEGNNMAIKGIATQYKSRGKHIITSSVEHASVLETCRQLEEQGFFVTYLPVNKNGHVTVEAVEKAIRPDTILVTLLHVNNEVGQIQPIGEIGEMLRNYPKVFFHVDNVQGIGKVPLSLENIDLCTISGHKFHSVKGTGILYMNESVRLSPLLTGGQQESGVRGGTENLPGIVATARALRMTLENQQEKQGKMNALLRQLITLFQELDKSHVNSPANSAPHILNVSFPGLKPEVVVHAFAKEEIYVSTKSACSSKLQRTSHVLVEMGLPKEVVDSAIRISLSTETAEEEITTFIEKTKKIIGKLYEV